MLVLYFLCVLVGRALTDKYQSAALEENLISHPERCLAPNNQEGLCVPLSSCPEVVKAFVNPKRSAEDFLRRFICDYRGQIKVCCNVTLNTTKLSQPDFEYGSAEDFARKVQFFETAKKFCSIPNYYARYGKDSTTISLLQLRAVTKGSDEEFTKCLGVLITERYVLTAAECLVQTCRTPRFAVVGVRFKVTNPSEEYYRHLGIEEQIPHPFYDATSGINNIALLRLNSTVFKSKDNFWPNCLHIPEYHNLNLANTIAIAVRFHKDEKELIWSKLMSNKKCQYILESKNVSSTITMYEACIASVDNTTDIKSTLYPGEPLLVSDDDFNKGTARHEITTEIRDLYLGGISSSRTVYEEGLPIFYTNVSIYFDWMLENMRPWPANDEPCMTPDNKTGVCIFMVHCPALMEAFANPPKEQEEYLRQFSCETNEGDTGVYVCCSESFNSTTFKERIGLAQNISRKSPLLDFSHCGIQHKDDYFTTSDDITIDEFPWIATIFDRDHPTTVTYTGTLINARYVLTTAAETVYIDTDNLVVRLGDFSRSNKTDCVEEPDIFAVDCSEYEDFSIEEVIAHPFYSFLDDINNIALFRLNRKVTYTDFIRPICLPVLDTIYAKPGDDVYTSSWGELAEGEAAELKKKVSMKLLSHSTCVAGFRKYHDATFVTPYTACALYSKSNEIPLCFPDKGGSLMFHNNFQWHIEGILIDNFFFGYRDCTKKGKPLVYTKISKYLNWILENMRLPL